VYQAFIWLSQIWCNWKRPPSLFWFIWCIMVRSAAVMFCGNVLLCGCWCVVQHWLISCWGLYKLLLFYDTNRHVLSSCTLLMLWRVLCIWELTELNWTDRAGWVRLLRSVSTRPRATSPLMKRRLPTPSTGSSGTSQTAELSRSLPGVKLSTPTCRYSSGNHVNWMSIADETTAVSTNDLDSHGLSWTETVDTA